MWVIQYLLFFQPILIKFIRESLILLAERTADGKPVILISSSA
jgi:hypothetical protein